MASNEIQKRLQRLEERTKRIAPKVIYVISPNPNGGEPYPIYAELPKGETMERLPSESLSEFKSRIERHLPSGGIFGIYLHSSRNPKKS